MRLLNFFFIFWHRFLVFFLPTHLQPFFLPLIFTIWSTQSSSSLPPPPPPLLGLLTGVGALVGAGTGALVGAGTGALVGAGLLLFPEQNDAVEPIVLHAVVLIQSYPALVRA